jgi:hypothetical protein
VFSKIVWCGALLILEKEEEKKEKLDGSHTCKMSYIRNYIQKNVFTAV